MNILESKRQEAERAIENLNRFKRSITRDVEMLQIEAEHLFELAKAVTTEVLKTQNATAWELSEKWQDTAGRYTAQASDAVQAATRKVQFLQDMQAATLKSLHDLGFEISPNTEPDAWPEYFSERGEQSGDNDR